MTSDANGWPDASKPTLEPGARVNVPVTISRPWGRGDWQAETATGTCVIISHGDVQPCLTSSEVTARERAELEKMEAGDG